MVSHQRQGDVRTEKNTRASDEGHSPAVREEDSHVVSHEGCASWAMIPHVANLPTGFSMNHDGAFDQ